MNILRVSKKFLKLRVLFAKFKYFQSTINENTIQKLNIGYPVNYFLEYESKNFETESSTDQSLKIEILNRNIENLKYGFDEQNYIMALYRIQIYLENDKQKNAYDCMSSILKQNYTKLEKFSSCFTILYKIENQTFLIDKAIIECLVQHTFKTIKTQYTFRDYGTMLASFFELIYKKNLNVNQKLKNELQMLIMENHKKISFDGQFQILAAIFDNKVKENQSDFILQLLEDIEASMPFADFLKYFRILRIFLKIFLENFLENYSVSQKHEIMTKIGAIIRYFNICFEDKINKNFQAENLKNKYKNLIIKEYYEDVSLLLKIFVVLRDLGEIILPHDQNKNQKFEENFKQLFLNSNFRLSSLGKIQYNDCCDFYNKFLKNEDKDASLKKFMNILFGINQG